MFIKSFVPKRRSLIVPREHVLTTITGVNNVSRIYNRVHWIIYETTIGDVRDLWIVEFDVSDRRWDKFIAQMASDGFELVITADGIVLRKG